MTKSADPRYWRPRSWGRYQRKSDKTMSWVRVQVSIINDPDFLALTDKQKLHWLLILPFTARLSRPIPWDPAYIGQQLGQDSRGIGKTLQALRDCNFIEICERTDSLWGKEPTPSVEENRGEKNSGVERAPARTRAKTPKTDLVCATIGGKKIYEHVADDPEFWNNLEPGERRDLLAKKAKAEEFPRIYDYIEFNKRYPAEDRSTDNVDKRRDAMFWLKGDDLDAYLEDERLQDAREAG